MKEDTIHQSSMRAIENDEPFDVEDPAPRVLRNENTLRNRARREGRRASTRSDSHQRVYNFLYSASKTFIQIACRFLTWSLSQFYSPIAPLPTAQHGSAIDSNAVTYAILVMSDALCAAAEAIFDAIGDECETTLQTTTPIRADASTSTALPASSPLST